MLNFVSDLIYFLTRIRIYCVTEQKRDKNIVSDIKASFFFDDDGEEK